VKEGKSFQMAYTVDTCCSCSWFSRVRAVCNHKIKFFKRIWLRHHCPIKSVLQWNNVIWTARNSCTSGGTGLSK